MTHSNQSVNGLIWTDISKTNPAIRSTTLFVNRLNKICMNLINQKNHYKPGEQEEYVNIVNKVGGFVKDLLRSWTEKLLPTWIKTKNRYKKRTFHSILILFHCVLCHKNSKQTKTMRILYEVRENKHIKWFATKHFSITSVAHEPFFKSGAHSSYARVLHII